LRVLCGGQLRFNACQQLSGPIQQLVSCKWHQGFSRRVCIAH
jgi:hypothetical protein